jgi:hypothetical protein
MGQAPDRFYQTLIDFIPQAQPRQHDGVFAVDRHKGTIRCLLDPVDAIIGLGRLQQGGNLASQDHSNVTAELTLELVTRPC